uniref:Uncharacterized protein n=1 Tax=Schistosoma haematobium TaxID=6185 RepID=A0A094ZVA4_SCHHA
MELISKFRLILEQSFLTQDDIILDLMFPVDNYLMQSLLETSCQTYMTDSKNIQAEELDEKIKKIFLRNYGYYLHVGAQCRILIDVD